MIPVKKKNLADNKRKASRDEKEISIIMKKRYALLLTGLLTLSLAAGCGAKTDNAGETSAPAVSESQAAESTEQTADVQNTADQGEERRSQEQLMRSKISCLLSQMSLAQHMNSALRQHRKDWKM